MKNLTALIVSFYRTEYLELCVKSLHETYPEINIIVGNNGPEDKRKEEICREFNAKYYQLPFDCGICVGRNMLVDKIKTPYTLIGDDDFFYNKESGVDKLLRAVEWRGTGYHLVGGRIKEGGIVRNYQGFIHDNGNHFLYEKLDDKYLNTEYPIEVDLTFNFFVAKTVMIRDVRWDEKIKVAYEHSSFFIDAKRRGYKIGYIGNAIVDHKPPIKIKNVEEYQKYRLYRYRKNDKKRFFEKYKLNYCIDMSGRKDVYDGTGMGEVDFLITTMDRYECLENLLFSIAEFYPQAKIYIADQSKKFIKHYYVNLYEKLFKKGLKNKPIAFNLPYDCGLSYCRNFLVKKTNSSFCLILEDDFIFSEKTKVEKMAEILELDPCIGVVGGLVKECGFEVHFEHLLDKKNQVVIHSPDGNHWNNINDSLRYKITGSVLNFTLYRREVYNDLRWDDDLKIEGEHTDFMIRLNDTKWNIAYTDSVEIEHKKINSREYKDLRRRNEFLKIMMEKHNINTIKYLDGYTIALRDGVIYKGKNL